MFIIKTIKVVIITQTRLEFPFATFSYTIHNYECNRYVYFWINHKLLNIIDSY